MANDVREGNVGDPAAAMMVRASGAAMRAP
jgi:hypothetical protein